MRASDSGARRGAPGAPPPTAAPPPPRGSSAFAPAAPPAGAASTLFVRPVAAGSFYGGVHTKAAPGAPAQPLHDPSAPNALVLSVAADARFKPPAARAAVAVVVDPALSARLRPHQREGVSFLYECVMGLRGPHTGCLLCDEMGVGKTLQVIALLWTLLRQSPAGGGAPAVKRAIVVCPASLVSSWRSEVRKWLGPGKLGVAAIPGGPKAKAAFAAWAARGQVRAPLCVTSYETLRACAAEAGSACPGLLICDEGHRLKNAGGSKTLAALRALNAPKRIILSG
jgi:SNF2 family DNA or RNA helicase